MQSHDDTGRFPQQDEPGRGSATVTALNEDNHVLEGTGICLTVRLGAYNVYVCLDTSYFPDREALLKPVARRLRNLRRWRCEGIFLLAWLLHVCLVWTLRALEASEDHSACAKIPG